MMRLFRHMAFVLILTFSLCAFFSSKVHAIGIPVLDGATIGQSVLNVVKQLFEAKITAETQRLAGKLNSTIGDTPFDPHKIFEKNVIKDGDKGDYGDD